MVDHVKSALESVEGGVENVKVLVIGALGRCGSGAVDLFRKAGLKECVSESAVTSRDGSIADKQGQHCQVGHGRD
jgi:hypothetical protein